MTSIRDRLVEQPWSVYRQWVDGGYSGLWNVADANDVDIARGLTEDEARLFAAAPGLVDALEDIGADFPEMIDAAARGEFTQRHWAYHAERIRKSLATLTPPAGGGRE